MGPLSGVKIVEFAGLGPAPFCAMLLADMGAEVIRIDRTSSSNLPVAIDPRRDVMNRGRRSIVLDLKNPGGIEATRELLSKADGLIEGFRPGVMERMGLGPDACAVLNPRLVYGRMTGWGQTGPMSQKAGHDINYIALSGVLDMIGRKGERPLPPLNLVGDMGGGGLLLAFGLVCALLEARGSGRGQVVDASMVEGAAVQLSGILTGMAGGLWTGARGENFTDTGSHFYEVYETADGGHIAVGAIERQFYDAFCTTLGLDAGVFGRQMDSAAWPSLKAQLAKIFKTRSRDAWVALFEGVDACVTPVLSLKEAVAHPHNRERGVYLSQDGLVQAAPAPRFSRTPGAVSLPPPRPGEHSAEILSDWGLTKDRIQALRLQKAFSEEPADEAGRGAQPDTSP